MARKYFTKEELIKLNKKSIKENRNRNLVESFVEKLPKNTMYPIAIAFVHNNREMRTVVILDDKGNQGQLDISFKDYKSLNSMEVIDAS